MFRRALILAALALTIAATTARADEVPRTISVTGLGEVAATPDIAHATVGVRTVAETARAALSGNSATMAAVLDALRSRGIAERDMRTTNVSLHPRWGTEVMDNGTRAQVLTGYEAANLLRVTCRDLSKLGELLDALAGAGANDMRGIRFDVDDKGKLMDEARAIAVRSARAKAQLYAREAGVSLGAVLSISEAGVPTPVHRNRAMAEMAVAAPVPIAAGEQTISASVSMTFAIE
ncbi:MAG: SIMPL domain-containing protein [Alphaproteobacteria bacterium]